jgi:hypothetical protein
VEKAALSEKTTQHSELRTQPFGERVEVRGTTEEAAEV